MQITLNNKTENLIQDSLSLQELINYKNFTFHMLVTKLNGKLIKKADRTSTMIEDGDHVAIIHMISGG